MSESEREREGASERERNGREGGKEGESEWGGRERNIDRKTVDRRV